MKRRHFLPMLAGALFPSGLRSSPATKPRVAVIGAGMAGLSAARHLRAAGVHPVLFEARARSGGRIHTDRSWGVPLDLGASWIHGTDGNPLTGLAREYGIIPVPTDEDSVQVTAPGGGRVPDDALVRLDGDYAALLESVPRAARSGEAALTTIQRLDRTWLDDPLRLYALTAYLEFDSGGELGTLSSRHGWADRAHPGPDAVLPRGFSSLTDALAVGLEIHSNTPVESFRTSGKNCEVGSRRGTEAFDALISTIPLGVLKSTACPGFPPLPRDHAAAVERLGMGVVNKVVIEFDRPFWDNGIQFFGNATGDGPRGRLAYWWNASSVLRRPVLVGFATGPWARTMEALDEARLAGEVRGALASTFGKGVPAWKQLTSSRWGRDPWARGAYSFCAAGATPDDFTMLSTPPAPRWALAGEHTIAAWRGTAHGAFLSGIRAANQILKNL